jgi:dephospho-CoA kinase
VSDRFPVTILIQGGIACGKSTIARLVEGLGAQRLDCDRIAHEVLNSEEVSGLVAEAFGPHLVLEDGSVDRSSLGALVFEDSAALQRLEGWIHPRVAERVALALQAAATPLGEPRSVVVVDAAVAEKMQLTKGDYDLRLFVDAPLEARQERAATRGWSEGEVERREASQEPLVARRERADFILPNAGTLAEAKAHVERFWTEFVEPHRNREYCDQEKG